MWGHDGAPSLTCSCSVCNCLRRIFLLIAQGSGLPNFLEGVGSRLRLVEAEVRDDLFRRGFVEGRLQTPNPGPLPQGPEVAASTTPEGAPEPTEASTAESAAPREVKSDNSQTAAAGPPVRTAEEKDLEIYPKYCPVPPKRDQGPATLVKAEEVAAEEPPETKDTTAAEPTEGEEEKAPKEEKSSLKES